MDQDNNKNGVWIGNVFYPYPQQTPKVNSDLSKVSRVCTHCGRTDNLEQMGGYASFICIEGNGCRAEYTPGWGLYFFGAIHIDIPYIIVFGLIIRFAFNLLSPLLYSVPTEGTIALGVLFGVFSLVIPFAATFFAGIPMFLSMFFLTSYSISILFD